MTTEAAPVSMGAASVVMLSRLRIIRAVSCGVRDMPARLNGDLLTPPDLAAGLSAAWNAAWFAGCGGAGLFGWLGHWIC